MKEKQIAINKNLSANSKDLLKKLLKKNFQDRIGVKELLRHQAFANPEELTGDLSPEEFSVMKTQYLKNVRSNKRVLPERIEKSIAHK